jgi:hypothetical protein
MIWLTSLVAFLAGVACTLTAGLVWLAWQSAMIDREQNAEAWHDSRD